MARPRKGRIALVAAVAALLAGCGAGAPRSTVLAPGGTTGDIGLQRQLVADVSGAGAVPHLAALQRIADQNGGNRASPGPGYDASVEYVVGVLREAGYDVSAPAFRFEDEETGQQVTMRNIIAQTRTGGADHVVMVGAHLDSVPEGPGINDNGSGVAALLETATRLGGSPRLINAVRFAFWGAEEVDLVGSTEYVASLSAADRNRIMLYLNVDMVGSPNAGYFVQGGVGDEPEQTRGRGRAGADRTARVSRGGPGADRAACQRRGRRGNHHLRGRLGLHRIRRGRDRFRWRAERGLAAEGPASGRPVGWTGRSGLRPVLSPGL